MASGGTILGAGWEEVVEELETDRFNTALALLPSPPPSSIG